MAGATGAYVQQLVGSSDEIAAVAAAARPVAGAETGRESVNAAGWQCGRQISSCFAKQ